MSNDVVINPFAALDDRQDANVPTATLQIYEFIADYLARKDKDTHVNRASAASMCFKRRWFQRNGYEGEVISPRKIVNFTLGDLTEHVVKYFILKGCVGEGKLYSAVDFGTPTGEFTVQWNKRITIFDQEHLTADIAGIKVTAHVDGWGKRNSDGKFELIEVKSAADYGFDSFKEDGPGDYLKQAHVNMMTNKGIELGVTGVRFFYLKKNTGHLWDKLFSFNHMLFEEIKLDYLKSNQEEEPETPYKPIFETFRGKPTGRQVLQWMCGYCPYTQKCHPLAELEFKNDKPKYVINKTGVNKCNSNTTLKPDQKQKALDPLACF